MRIVVRHTFYGCETGCCGHVIEDEKGEQVGRFEFTHPYDGKETFRAWAEEFVREAGCDPSDLDWENCEVSDD